ncbi:MAG: hypothetical protein KDI27_09915 [Gammaproteobacteria bacterium]|nr:hypothetical protein [Gammaproteobacteria bacterium]
MEVAKIGELSDSFMPTNKLSLEEISCGCTDIAPRCCSVMPFDLYYFTPYGDKMSACICVGIDYQDTTTTVTGYLQSGRNVTARRSTLSGTRAILKYRI